MNRVVPGKHDGGGYPGSYLEQLLLQIPARRRCKTLKEAVDRATACDYLHDLGAIRWTTTANCVPQPPSLPPLRPDAGGAIC
jgi:hypothetical protein